MLVISDTSPLRYLAVIDGVELLATIFGEVWVPRAVLDEMSASSSPELVRALVRNPPVWLCTREPSEQTLALVSRDLDKGERAALALALDLHADLLLIDDTAGRREAESLGIRITGTVGFLRLAAERGLINVPVIVQELRRSGFYIHDSVIKAAFGKWLS